MEEDFKRVYEQQSEINGFEATAHETLAPLQKVMSETKENLENMTLDEMVLAGLLIVPGCSYARAASSVMRMGTVALEAARHALPKPSVTSKIPEFRAYFENIALGPSHAAPTGYAEVYFKRSLEGHLQVHVEMLQGFTPHGEHIQIGETVGGSRWVLRDLMRVIEKKSLQLGASDFELRACVINPKLLDVLQRHTTPLSNTSFLVRLDVSSSVASASSRRAWSEALDPLARLTDHPIVMPMPMPVSSVVLSKPITKTADLVHGGRARYTLTRAEEGHLVVELQEIHAFNLRTGKLAQCSDSVYINGNWSSCLHQIRRDAEALGVKDFVLRGEFTNERFRDILARKFLRIHSGSQPIGHWPYVAEMDSFLIRMRGIAAGPALALQSLEAFASSTAKLGTMASIGAALSKLSLPDLEPPNRTPSQNTTSIDGVCNNFNAEQKARGAYERPIPQVLTPLQARMNETRPHIQRTINIQTVSELKEIFPAEGNVYRGVDGNIFAINRSNNTVMWIQDPHPPAGLRIPNWWEISIPSNLRHEGPHPYITNVRNMPPQPSAPPGPRVHLPSGLVEIPGVKFIGRCGEQHHHNGRTWNIGMPCDVCRNNRLVSRCGSWVTVFL